MPVIEHIRLKVFDLFEELRPQDLLFIASNCLEMTLAAGELLIREGQVGKDVYLLEAGCASVTRGDPPRQIAILQAPAIIGEMALFDPERIRTSSVRAVSDLFLLSIPIKTFLVLVGAYPSVRTRLRQLIESRH